MIHKDLFGRYKNSFLGFGWHFFHPIILMIIYYIVYSSGIRSSPIDYFIVYLSSALFPFSFMVSNLSNGAGYIIESGSILKKIYFPREIVVISHVISSFVIMIIGYIIVILLIVISGYELNLFLIFFIIVIFILLFFFVLGYVFLFSSITVYIRDIRYLISSISMIFMFVTPVYFTTANMSGLINTIAWINPFTYFIEAIHDCIYYKVMPSAEIIMGCSILAFLSFTIGLITFKKLKRGFIERL